MWRLPVVHSTGPDQSCRFLRFLKDQGAEARETPLPRYDRKPKRFFDASALRPAGPAESGPRAGARLLAHLGSVERVMTADAATLEMVRGIGRKKAARIRALVCAQNHQRRLAEPPEGGSGPILVLVPSVT
jgi:ERCC4-type nuclease